MFRIKQKGKYNSKNKKIFLSDTRINILAVLGRQNFNNFVSGGIYLRPHVLMVTNM